MSLYHPAVQSRLGGGVPGGRVAADGGVSPVQVAGIRQVSGWEGGEGRWGRGERVRGGEWGEEGRGERGEVFLGVGLWLMVASLQCKWQIRQVSRWEGGGARVRWGRSERGGEVSGGRRVGVRGE